MKFGLEKRSAQALIYKDEENDVFTVFSLEKGGPIVSDNSIELAKTKFEDALRLASAVRNLLFFEGSRKSESEKARKLYASSPIEKIGDVEYQEMTV